MKFLNNQKQIGPSSIPPWALKDGCDITIGHLTKVINSFSVKKSFPNLKTAYVTPMFKKDDPDNPESYRPISVTSFLSKIFERLRQKQIAHFLHNERVYSETQFGFRNNYSTIDALLFCTESFRLAVDNNKLITAALLDL